MTIYHNTTQSQVERQQAVPKLEVSHLQQETGVFICCLITWPGASHLAIMGDTTWAELQKREEKWQTEHKTCGRDTSQIHFFKCSKSSETVGSQQLYVCWQTCWEPSFTPPSQHCQKLHIHGHSFSKNWWWNICLKIYSISAVPCTAALQQVPGFSPIWGPVGSDIGYFPGLFCVEFAFSSHAQVGSLCKKNKHYKICRTDCFPALLSTSDVAASAPGCSGRKAQQWPEPFLQWRNVSKAPCMHGCPNREIN